MLNIRFVWRIVRYYQSSCDSMFCCVFTITVNYSKTCCWTIINLTNNRIHTKGYKPDFMMIQRTFFLTHSIFQVVIDRINEFITVLLYTLNRVREKSNCLPCRDFLVLAPQSNRSLRKFTNNWAGFRQTIDTHIQIFNTVTTTTTTVFDGRTIGDHLICCSTLLLTVVIPCVCTALCTDSLLVLSGIVHIHVSRVERMCQPSALCVRMYVENGLPIRAPSDSRWRHKTSNVRTKLLILSSHIYCYYVWIEIWKRLHKTDRAGIPSAADARRRWM